MTKETRTPEPLYYMDLCQGAFLIEINDPAGSLPGSDLIVARTRNDANLQFISNGV
jgi:hypothetical protein